ncbi:MAG: hypothetical protein A2X64_07355, partial [Ignavibacteria bacterium GWF2_33_9]
MEPAKKKLWDFPWKYRESFIISFSILIVGFLLEYYSENSRLNLPVFPNNLILLLVLISFITTTQKLVNHPFVKWLSSVYAAISVICVFTLLILTMGMIKQTETNEAISFMSKLGLSHIIQSYPYFLLTLFLLIILGFTIVKRLTPFNIKNTGFFLNHAGLFIILSAGSLGLSDVSTYYMSVKEGQTEWNVYDTEGQMYEMPLAINLKSFNMEEYPPNLILVDAFSGEIIKQKKSSKLPEVSQGMTCTINDWSIQVKTYYHKSVMNNSEFIAATDTINSSAAYIIADNKKTKTRKEGWICSEGPIQMPMPL